MFHIKINGKAFYTSFSETDLSLATKLSYRTE